MQAAMDTLAQDFSAHINFDKEKVDEEAKKEDREEKEEEEDNDYEHDEDDEESDDNDDDFSFVFDGVDAAAEETRLVFPLFNTDLLLTERPPVKHVYAAEASFSGDDVIAAASSSGDDVIAGPCCEWSKEKAAVAAGREGCCKKSNSTGFSKLWRLRDLAHRSNSDGRDAFVFLNHPSSTAKPKINAAEKKIAGGVKVNGGGVNGENKVTAGQKKMTKNVTALAHERYMRSKAKDEERRRSYLPYRPELVGFFTNVNGGLTRNIHPY